MLTQQMIGQPGTSGAKARNIDALINLIRSGVTEFDAAVAYVTNSGVDTLLHHVVSQGAVWEWATTNKRFLVSIDWYRSDPTALERLLAVPASVRVHDGKRVVERKGCIPYVPWHPKWFAARGPSVRGQLIGSGNLSRNGLLTGHEAGLLQVVRKPTNRTERDVDLSIQEAESWFGRIWRRATPLASVLDQYSKGFAAQPKSNVGRNDDITDGSGRVGARHALTAEQLAALTTANNFWIEGGVLSRNRGPSRPGNQLMMSALMRVFFGSPSTEVPLNTHVGWATIEHPRSPKTVVSAPIRFSDNSMDVISLPVPESPWPATYDDQALLFTKASRGDELHFVMSVRTVARAGTWRKASTSEGTNYSMRSGRRWGVFG
jgi:HKD family nuclease